MIDKGSSDPRRLCSKGSEKKKKKKHERPNTLINLGRFTEKA